MNALLCDPCPAQDNFTDRSFGYTKTIRDFFLRNFACRVEGANFTDITPANLSSPVFFSPSNPLGIKTRWMVISSLKAFRFYPRSVSIANRSIAAILSLSVLHVGVMGAKPKIFRITVVNLWRHIVAMTHVHSVRNLVRRIGAPPVQHPHHSIHKKNPPQNVNRCAMWTGPIAEPRPNTVGAFFDSAEKSDLDIRRDGGDFFSSGSHINVCRIVRAIWPLKTVRLLALI